MLHHVLGFLMSVVFGLFLWVLLLRLVLQFLGARYHHPVSQLLLQLSEWLIAPCKRLTGLRPFKGVDCVILFWVICVGTLDVWLSAAVVTGALPSLPVSVFLALVLILQRMIHLFIAAIIIRGIMSWFAQPNTWFLELVVQLTEPLLIPFRRWIPAMAGFDLSLLAALVALQLVNMLLQGLL
mgnify:CR=1 FL=1